MSTSCNLHDVALEGQNWKDEDMRLRNEYMGIYLEPETEADKKLVLMISGFLKNLHIGKDLNRCPDTAFYGHEGQEEEIRSILMQYGIQFIKLEDAVRLFKQGRSYLEAEYRRETPRRCLESPPLD